MEYEDERLPIQIHPSETTQSLPNEVVLLILESLVAQAVADAWPVAFMVSEGRVERSNCRLRVEVDHNVPQRGDNLERRFETLLQTPLAINKHSRALTRKHFIPYPLSQSYRRARVLCWICPSIDRFKFEIEDVERMMIGLAAHIITGQHPTTSRLQQAFENPSPADAELVRGMQIVHGYPSTLFSPSSLWARADLETIFSLPHLRELHIYPGVNHHQLRKFHDEASSYKDPRPIDTFCFPDLAESNLDGGVFERWARRAEEMGVRIFGTEQRDTVFPRRFFELLWTPEGTRMKFIPPDELHWMLVPLYDSDGEEYEE